MKMQAFIRRKDFRSQRPLLLLYWGALAVQLAHHLEWLSPLGGSEGDTSSGGFTADRIGTLLGSALGSASFLLMALAAGGALFRAIIDDGPADRDRFLATRPVTGRDVVCAKLGFALLHLLLPAALAAGFYLTAGGLGIGEIALGIGQVVLIGAGALALVAAFALPWRDGIVALGGLAAVVVGGVVAQRLLEVFREVLSPRDPATPIAFLQAVAVTAPLVAAAACVVNRRNARMPARHALVLTGTALFVVVLHLTRWRDLPLRVVGGDGAESVETVPAPLIEGRLGLMRADDGVELQLTWSASTAPSTDPSGHWTCDLVSVSTPLSGTVRRDAEAADPLNSVRRNSMMRGVTPGMHRLLTERLGIRPLWMVQSEPLLIPDLHRSIPLAAALPPDEGVATRISAEIAAHLWSEEIAADLPLVAGATDDAKDPVDRWTVTGVHRDDRDQAFHIGLIRRQREFWLSRDPALRARRDLLDPGTLFSYVIYDPGTGLASPVHQYQAVRESRGSASGLRRHRIALSPWFHRIPASWRLIDPSSLRLLVVRRRPIRSESLSWVSRPFASADLPQLSGGGGDRPDEPLDRGAFTAWFDALDLPSTDAPEKVVAEHVLRLLEQVARCRFPFEAGHPAVGELARFVPGHPTLFMNALRRVPSGEHRVVQILQDALIQGADPSQREAVLAAFPSTPDLLPVIDARGWFGGVVPMIPDLAERAGQDAAYLGGLAALETRDPALLLARFARHPNRGTFDLIRAFPGVDPEEVDSLVGTLWSTRPPAMHEHGWPTSGLEIALRHGIPDALGALGRFMDASLIDQPDAAGHSQIGHLLMEIVDLSSLPEQERWAPDRVVDWFVAQRPEAFHFDPVSRRWTTGSGSLASACPE